MLKNKFTLFFLGFGVGIIILGFIVFSVEYSLHNDDNVYTVKNKNFLEKIHDIQILVLGSSHALFGISAKTLSEHAFNMSNVSQSYNYDAEILEKYLDKMDNLKVVILPISSFSFNLKLGFEHPEDFRKYYYKYFMDIVPGEINFDEGLGKNFLQNYFLTFALGFMRSMQDIYLDGITAKIDKVGDYHATIGNANYFDEIGKSAAARHKKPLILADRLADFIKIKTLLDAKGVKLLLVVTPTLAAYNMYYPDNIMDKFCKQILQDLEVESQYLFSDFYSKDKGYVPSDFHDPDHLSNQGAKKFSTRLRDYLLTHPELFGKIN